jgi:hypothetical protein
MRREIRRSNDWEEYQGEKQFCAALLEEARSRRFDELVHEARIVIESVTEAQARIAREAYRDFGRGSGHPETKFRRLFCLCALKGYR